MQEDPTFKVHTDPETNQTIIRGMGELHLEIIVDRMVREFNVAANVGKPQVAYREAITRASQAEGKFIRQSGGKGQYGHVKMRFEPMTDGQGLRVRQRDRRRLASRASSSSRSSRASSEAMEKGVLAGYPMTGIRAILYDGSYHDVDSSEMAFKIAGSMAFQEGAQEGRPVLLEPIMDVEAVTPEEFAGDVMGDLSRRRGKIQQMEERGGAKVIRAHVPLSEMFGYATQLRSMSPGARQLHDAVPCVRAGAEERRRRSDREESQVNSAIRRLSTEPLAERELKTEVIQNGQREIRSQQTAREHRHDRSRRPRQDHADGGDHEGSGGEGDGEVRRLRSDRQGPRRARARHHDRDRARRVLDREAPLRARRLPGSRRLRQEHDHGRRADGRRDSRRLRRRRPDASDARAHPARPSGRRSLHRRLPQQGRHGRRSGAARPRRAGSPRAPLQLRVPRRRHPDHPRLRPQGARERRSELRVGQADHGADGRRRHLHPDPGARRSTRSS